MERITTILFIMLYSTCFSQEIKLKIINDELYYTHDSLFTSQKSSISVLNQILFSITNDSDKTYVFFLNNNLKTYDYYEGKVRPSELYSCIEINELTNPQLFVQDTMGLFQNIHSGIFGRDAIIANQTNRFNYYINNKESKKKCFVELISNYEYILKAGETKYFYDYISFPNNNSHDWNKEIFSVVMNYPEKYEFSINLNLKKSYIQKFIPKDVMKEYEEANIYIFDGELQSNRIPVIPITTEVR